MVPARDDSVCSISRGTKTLMMNQMLFCKVQPLTISMVAPEKVILLRQAALAGQVV